LLYAIGLGFLPTSFAYSIYTLVLSKTEASIASILTTVKPVFATLIGIFIFIESFSLSHMIGMSFIIGPVILLQAYNDDQSHEHITLSKKEKEIYESYVLNDDLKS